MVDAIEPILQVAEDEVDDRHELFGHLEAARLAPRPADQTFALTLAHTGARVSEALAVQPMDIDLKAASIRVRTLKRRAEHWREGPRPSRAAPRPRARPRALRSTPAKAAGKPLWPWSRVTAHRKIARTMADVGIEGPPSVPEGPAAWFRHRGRPGPRQPADHRDLHRHRGSRGEGFSGSDVGSEGGVGRIQHLKASGEDP